MLFSGPSLFSTFVWYSVCKNRSSCERVGQKLEALSPRPLPFPTGTHLVVLENCKDLLEGSKYKYVRLFSMVQ